MWCWWLYRWTFSLKIYQDDNIKLICADIKPLEYWFQVLNSNNYSLDLKDYVMF